MSCSLNYHSLLIPLSCCALPTFGLFAETAEQPKRQPDIVFVLVDDMRRDSFSFMRHPFVKTPILDSLRASGANLANTFCPTAICGPSRANFLTGTYAHTHGVVGNGGAEYDPLATPAFPQVLQQVGYQTAWVGKWHQGRTDVPRPGFDYWVSFLGQGRYFGNSLNVNGKTVQRKEYITDLLTDYAEDFIDSVPKDRPYFLGLGHKAVHEPFQPPPRHKSLYVGERLPKPDSWEDSLEGKPFWQRRQAWYQWMLPRREARQPDNPFFFRRTRAIEAEEVPDVIPPSQWKGDGNLMNQLRCVKSVDESVGRLIEKLRKRGTLDNTIFVFASDNGYFHYEHRRKDKRLAYEEAMRIPMIISFPGRIAANSTVEELVENVDLAPTLLDYAGAPIPESVQGRSLRPLLEGRSTPWRDAVLYEYWRDLSQITPTMVGVRTKDWKLVQYPESGEEEVYDLANDQHEMTNLAANPEYREKIAELRARLERLKAETHWRRHVRARNITLADPIPQLLLDIRAVNGGAADQGPQRLKIRGKGGDSSNSSDSGIRFDGTNALTIAGSERLDPSKGPFWIHTEVFVEEDGIIAVQPGATGWQLFVQDGRPGFSARCDAWLPVSTTIDAAAQTDVRGKWVKLAAFIDYNNIALFVDGQLVERIDLAQPYDITPGQPLLVGCPAKDFRIPTTPEKGFCGRLRRLCMEYAEWREQP